MMQMRLSFLLHGSDEMLKTVYTNKGAAVNLVPKIFQTYAGL